MQAERDRDDCIELYKRQITERCGNVAAKDRSYLLGSQRVSWRVAGGIEVPFSPYFASAGGGYLRRNALHQRHFRRWDRETKAFV